MLHNAANGTTIQNALHDPDKTKIIKLLEKYPDPLDLAEVAALIADQGLLKNIHHAAYLYLVANAPLATLQIYRPCMDFNYRDHHHHTAVLVATRMGRHDVLLWLREIGLPFDIKDADGDGLVLNAAFFGRQALFRELVKPIDQGGFGLSSDVKDNDGNDVVLSVISNNNLPFLRELVMPVNEGGFGLPLNIKNTCGQCVVLMAVTYSAVDLLRALIKPVQEGGFGLSLNVESAMGYGPIMTAIRYNELTMLKTLLAPLKDDGFGLSLQDDLHERALKLAKKYNYENIFIFIFLYHFNRLLQESAEKAVTWSQQNHSKYKFSGKKIISTLIDRCKELIDSYLESTTDEHILAIEIIANYIEELATGEGCLYLAEKFLEKRYFTESYQQYSNFLKNDAVFIYKKEKARLEMANLIFNGDIMLDDQGSLDEGKTVARYGLSEEQRRLESQQWDIIYQRVIYSYEYVYQNKSSSASFLLERFDEILSGSLSLAINIKSVPWRTQAIDKYKQYYSNKNTSLLSNPVYKYSEKWRWLSESYTENQHELDKLKKQNNELQKNNKKRKLSSCLQTPHSLFSSKNKNEDPSLPSNKKRRLERRNSF